jgi:hypothetical protein
MKKDEKRPRDALDRIAEDAAADPEDEMSAEEVKATLAEHGLDDEKARAMMKDIVDRATGANVVRPARWWTSRAAIGLGVVAAAAAIIVILGRRSELDVPVAAPFDAGVEDAAPDAGDAR